VTETQAGERCRSGAECGLCFSRRMRYTRPRKPGANGPSPWVPLTGPQWRAILGPVAKYEGYPSDLATAPVRVRSVP
jgi:hypothetical protein